MSSQNIDIQNTDCIVDYLSAVSLKVAPIVLLYRVLKFTNLSVKLCSEVPPKYHKYLKQQLYNAYLCSMFKKYNHV